MSHLRKPRFRRAPEIAPIQLTERDRMIVRCVFQHRFLRSWQIAALVGGSKQAVLRRLQLLFHHGYLERPRAQATTPRSPAPPRPHSQAQRFGVWTVWESVGRVMNNCYETVAVISVFAILLRKMKWRRGTLLHPFCHLVLRAGRVDSPPWAKMPQTLPELIRKYRQQRRLSQAALGVKFGITQVTIGCWERGVVTPQRQFWPGLQALLDL